MIVRWHSLLQNYYYFLPYLCLYPSGIAVAIYERGEKKLAARLVYRGTGWGLRRNNNWRKLKNFRGNYPSNERNLREYTLKWMKNDRKIATRNRMDLETLGFRPIIAQKISRDTVHRTHIGLHKLCIVVECIFSSISGWIYRYDVQLGCLVLILSTLHTILSTYHHNYKTS